ncbi:MAG: GntR family transcriptional regulator [Lachnospiraceae bacterium]|nr:GntR family transcriptional regulator [Lachnospiraceae bacterium]MDD3795443.1 GntR family transcriptional regulator [Lachnospiraceae bacterium]
MAKKQENEAKETLVDTIAKNIKLDIIRQELHPGQRIQAKELANKYGTSETPVKLALNRLLSEQVVENFPRQGMQIKAMNEEDAKEIFSLRLMMDLYYTKEIIEAVQLNKLLRVALADNVNKHLEVIKRYADHNNVELYMENYMLDNEFHELYLKCSGNKKLVDLYHSVNPFMYSNYIFKKQSSEKDISGVVEHQEIIQAIFDKDEERLRHWLRVHNNNAVRSIDVIMKTDRIM